jgi:hypothetical protein
LVCTPVELVEAFTFPGEDVAFPVDDVLLPAGCRVRKWRGGYRGFGVVGGAYRLA